MQKADPAKLDSNFERVQLARLARSVLERPAGEVKAIAADNPALVREWIAEIRSSRDAAEAEARLMTAALHRLLNSHRSETRTAA